MSWTTIVVLVFVALVDTFAAYISRLYSEFGKILPREVQDNLDQWEENVEPLIGLTREHAALCAAVLQQLTLGTIALAIGAVLFDRAPHAARPNSAEIAQAVLVVLLVLLFCNQILPNLLFTHTKGRWAAKLVWPIRLLLWLMTPITAVIRFFFSLAALAEAPAKQDEEPAPDVESLLEAGEEEGILEESDRDLVRSAVEFGDKLVREVMTPRPQIFAVQQSITLETFLEKLKEHNYSRVPVYDRTLDSVTGIAFAHDLLQISDEEARSRTVASIQQPAVFVPETKRGYELLREMQREKQHMRVVIDEYGGVAGLVTIEDLLEEIVGAIRDEHEMDAHTGDPQKEPSGAWVVPGDFPVGELPRLFGGEFEIYEEYEATTVGGLVSEVEGRIPLPGEVVLLEHSGLRIQVVASTDRRVDRLRIYPPAKEEATAMP
ncbi:MAG TPA: CBS domain-containing protein [Terracidiphilus sp.]|nr:CBS domain-containing protein [Terracidiphilus sp.]